MQPTYTLADEHGNSFTIPKRQFQLLHSAGRSLLRSAVQSNDLTREASLFLVELDEAIDVGHKILGTDRPSADKYVELVYNVTSLHMDQARAILEKEDLLQKLPE